MLHNVREAAPLKTKRLAREGVKADTLMQTLQNKTPAQVGAWIDVNVNSLADAKRVLKALAKAVVMLSHD